MSERMTFSAMFDVFAERGFFTILHIAVDNNLSDVYPGYFAENEGALSYGISSYAVGRELGALYHIMGDKITSLDEIAQYLSLSAYIHFKEEWKRQYNALYSNYNPINNYSMTENGEDTRTNTGTQSTSGTRSETEKETPNLTNTTTGENNSSGGLYGFNSAESVPSDNTHGTNTNTNTQSGTVNTDTSGTTSSTRNDDLTEKSVHTFERSGNIGVTTSQQMIESELELRKKQFYSIVYKDIVNYLCLSVY